MLEQESLGFLAWSRVELHAWWTQQNEGCPTVPFTDQGANSWPTAEGLLC